MPHIANRTLTPLLVLGIMVCVGYVAAQQGPARVVTLQSAEKTSPQQNGQIRDPIVQLQTQVKELQAAIDDLKSKQQSAGEELTALSTNTDRQQRQIDKLEQQVGRAALQLERVKTKIGLY
jgi:peptidoglycan hydrolase CwlO-like protein